MSTADKRQVGGGHYKGVEPSQEHWNLAVAYQWNYLQAQCIKYLMRYDKKGGVEDLKKAQHFLEKLIEVEMEEANNVPVNQDR